MQRRQLSEENQTAKERIFQKKLEAPDIEQGGQNWLATTVQAENCCSFGSCRWTTEIACAQDMGHEIGGARPVWTGV